MEQNKKNKLTSLELSLRRIVYGILMQNNENQLTQRLCTELSDQMCTAIISEIKNEVAEESWQLLFAIVKEIDKIGQRS